MSTVQNPRKTWLATGSLITVCWRMPVSAAEIASCFWLWLSYACLSASGRVGGRGLVLGWIALLWYSLNPLSCEQVRLRFRAFCRKVLFFFSSLTIPQFGLLSHMSSLIVLRASRPCPYPKQCSPCLLSSPCLLMADTSVWATSLLAVAVGHVFCVVFFFFLPVMLPSEIPKLPTELPVRGFPTVWNLFLLYDSHPRMGLCLSFVSHILSYLLSKRMGCLSGLVSSASVQKLFCGSFSAFK